MVNLYAYTYPSQLASNAYPGYTKVKIGKSERNVHTRMNEQGGASEAEEKIVVGEWNDLKVIKGDHEVHAVLRQRGLWRKDGAGTEWFIIPSKDVNKLHDYVDALVTDLEGRKIRPSVILREMQQRKLDEALDIIKGKDGVDIVANLCPRFGKTIWALKLFNELPQGITLKKKLLTQLSLMIFIYSSLNHYAAWDSKT